MMRHVRMWVCLAARACPACLASPQHLADPLPFELPSQRSWGRTPKFCERCNNDVELQLAKPDAIAPRMGLQARQLSGKSYDVAVEP